MFSSSVSKLCFHFPYPHRTLPLNLIRHFKSFSSVPLTDSFNRKHTYLRISLTEKCNLRCTYCMPEEGVELTPKEKLLTSDEVVKLATLFVTKLGVNKIRLTGGEPTVAKEFTSILTRLAQLKSDGLETLAMTTNGIKLSRSVHDLKKLGLDAVNISLDTLDPHKFNLITRRNAFKLVMAGIEAALDAGFSHPVKINCVVMRNINLDEVPKFVQMTKDKPLDVRFIEYMPFDGNKWSCEKMVATKDLIELIEIATALPLVSVAVGGGSSEASSMKMMKEDATAKSYRVPGHLGTIGFISSMSDAFCGSCNRLRITADGCLKVCLFDRNEVSLKHHLRHGSNDQQVQQVIQNALKTKKAKHAGAFNIAKSNNRPMILIAKQKTNSNAIASSMTVGILKMPFPGLNKTTHQPLNHINFKQMRFLSHFTHLTRSGQVKMVDVTAKEATFRTAAARATISLGSALVSLIASEAGGAKGDVLTTAKLAGIQAAKCTSSLIPLCHLIPLGQVDVEATLTQDQAVLTCRVAAHHRTGVEMEALTGASVAALTIYDMCKAINQNMVITEVKLLSKTKGGIETMSKAEGES